MSVDLRLAIPAALAWIAAGVMVAMPEVALEETIACWVAAGVLASAAVTTRRGWLAVATVAAIAAALVSTAVAVQSPVRHPAVMLESAKAGRYVTVTVATSESAAGNAREDPLTAEATSVSAGGVVYAVSTPVLLFGASVPAATGIGTVLTVGGTLAAAEPEDDVGFLVFARGSPRVAAEPPWFLDWANGLRSTFSATATTLPGDGGALLPGLAIGDTAAVDEPLDVAMKASSLSHLTAVSGANCAVIIGLIMLGGAYLGLGRAARVLASLAVLAGFVVLVTPQSSVVRAATMAAVVLALTLGGRPVRGVPVLALATIGLLAADPWLSRDYGFALSVLATGGLLVLSGPIARLLSRVLPAPVALLVAVPIAAQLACQPVLVLLSPSIAVYGVVANALAEPAAPLATVIGLLACVTLPFLPWAGEMLAAVAWVPASWIAAVARFFAGLPGAALPWPGGAGGAGLLAAVTILGLVGVLGGVPHRMRRVAAAASAVVLIGIAGAMAGVRVVQQLARPPDWQIAACDIGQGDAVVVRSAGRVALVDTGPEPAPLEACLDSLGIDRIDLLVLSHFDLDHVGGTEAVFGRVDRVIAGPSAEPADDRLVASLVAAGASAERVSRGETGTLGELHWRVLWPRARLGPVEPGNEASVVVAFDGVGECAGGCLSSLFLGDLGETSQALLLAAGPLAHTDVVKVSHHGSADQSGRLYGRAAATVGVIGVGADNDYGHPTQKTLDLLAELGTAVTRTDTDGLVLLSPGPEAGSVRVWRERAGERE
ncbi:MAG: fold metallo-hydrolase [Microbacteriaceae bacterium]|nr:fold metallo-hydrolase [Microbacteriaceae bacterium]